MTLWIQDTLEQLFELLFVYPFLNLQDTLPDTALLKQFHTKIVEVDLQDADAVLVQFARQLADCPGHLHCVLRRIRADEKRDLVAQPLHFQEAFTGDHLVQMFIALGRGQFLSCQHKPPSTLSGQHRQRGRRLDARCYPARWF